MKNSMQFVSQRNFGQFLSHRTMRNEEERKCNERECEEDTNLNLERKQIEREDSVQEQKTMQEQHAK